MNAKKAKKLRKMLRQVEAGQKADGKEVSPVAYFEDTRKRKYITVPKTSFNPLVPINDGSDPNKSPTERIQVAPGTIQVAPDTVKGFYKKLKKAVAGKPINSAMEREQPPKL
jgi:hypothetical protein